MSDKRRGSIVVGHVRTPIAAQERAVAARDNVVRLWTTCPSGDGVTAYDRQHLPVFNWLLNAQSEGVPLCEMARVVFRIDPGKYPDRASTVVRTHLERAHWLRTQAFPYLEW